MILIEILETITLPIDPVIIEETAQTTLLVAGSTTDTDLTIVMTNDAQLHQLNKEFLDIDAPTDVLSFPAGEIDPDTDQPYLGDVLISVERASAQATTHSFEDELRLLVVHGVLHLLGYDHVEPGEKETMWQIQGEVLRGFGCADISPSNIEI